MNQFEKVAHRRAKNVLRVVTSDGTPVANTTLRFKQTNHKFLFGWGAFDFNAHFAVKDPEKKAFFKERMEIWEELFNYGTLPFYLGAYEPEEGNPQWESRMAAATYMKERGITAKGHPLCWHTACANWLMEYDNGTILRKQLKRIERDVTQFKGTVDIWDVINEVVIMPVFDKYDNAITRICQEYGRVPLIKKVFEEAKAANPDSTLLLNDFNTSENYAALIDESLHAGAPIDVIGIQSHQHQGYWGAEKLHAVLDRFSRFGKPIHFTENTLISGDIMPAHIVDLNDWQVDEWPSTPEGEERQKNELEEMYRIFFEHPLVEGVTGWDFTDGMWLKAPSGILRIDNSKKPAFHRLKELIKGEWWTDIEVHTDENGFVTVEGFKGDYSLLLDNKSAVLSLTEDCAEAVTVTLA